MGGEEEYEVEDILNSQVWYRRLEYFVKWKGYNVGHNSWIPHYDIHAPDLIAGFHRRNPGAPRQINAASFDSILFLKADTSLWWRSACQDAVP